MESMVPRIEVVVEAKQLFFKDFLLGKVKEKEKNIVCYWGIGFIKEKAAGKETEKGEPE